MNQQEQDEQAAKDDLRRAEIRLRELQLARVSGGAVNSTRAAITQGLPVTNDAITDLIRLGISGPHDGVVSVFSCITNTELLLPVADIGLLTARLRERNATADVVEEIGKAADEANQAKAVAQA